MQIDREAILQAKEKLGDRNAQIIVEELGITDFDEKNMKCCCPFHQEDHASFIYNKISFFKNGTMKKISKDKVTAELEPIIAQYATDKSKSGQPAKSYTFTDLPGLLRHLEVMVRDMHIQDFDLKSKMQIQLENLGYIDLTTNKKEDQRKLVILDIYPLRSKKTKEIWAYALQVRSIGTGKTNRWTIYSELYDRKPLQRYDTIYVPMNGWGERRGYLYLYNYDYVI